MIGAWKSGRLKRTEKPPPPAALERRLVPRRLRVVRAGQAVRIEDRPADTRDVRVSAAGVLAARKNAFVAAIARRLRRPVVTGRCEEGDTLGREAVEDLMLARE